MKQKEFNQLNERQIKALLSRHPNFSNIQFEILEKLGEETKEFYLTRKTDQSKRLVDETTGRMVSTFTANGNKYRIIKPEEGISLKRYTEYNKMLTIAGFNATFSEMIGYISRITNAFNSLVTKDPKLNILGEEIANMRKGLEKIDRNWDYSFYAATFFIVRPGEDLTTWNEELAEEKINDWNEEGLKPQDFFLSVILWGQQSAELRENSLKVARKTANAL